MKIKKQISLIYEIFILMILIQIILMLLGQRISTPIFIINLICGFFVGWKTAGLEDV